MISGIMKYWSVSLAPGSATPTLLAQDNMCPFRFRGFSDKSVPAWSKSLIGNSWGSFVMRWALSSAQADVVLWKRASKEFKKRCNIRTKG